MAASRVFISSTFVDLKEYRQAVQGVIRQLGAVDVSMEHFGARDEQPKDECLRLVREESDIFVGIYAHRYGFVPDGDAISISEAEYEAASLTGLKRYIYLVDDGIAWKPAYIDRGESETKLQEFKAKLKVAHMCQPFDSEDNLASKVAADLGRHLALQNLQRVSVSQTNKGGVPEQVDLRTAEAWSKHRQDTYDQNRNVFLVHTIAPSKEEGQTFDLFIYLKKHWTDDLSDVDHAEFFLGKHWDNQIFYVQNLEGFIGISASAYGSFLCNCRVTFKDGYQINISRYIDFEMDDAFR